VAFDQSVGSNAFTLGGLSGGENLALQNNAAAPIALSVGNNNTDTTHSGALSGPGSLIKIGTGNTALGGANSYSGTTTVSAGTLLVNGVHTGGGAYTVASGAKLGGIGSIASSVAVSAGGILGPGASVGTLTVDSANIDGKLQIEFDGDVDTIDKLAVTGALDITGSTVDFDNVGVGSLSGGPHIFASYSSLLGTFTVVDLPSGYSINYNYLGGNQIALISSAHPGDFDSDGDVDGADFVAWQTNFPTAFGATLAQGDADGDGDVDGADFVVWQTNFPFTPGPGASPVPEPGAVCLAICGLIGVGALRRRRASQKS
jgi:autotransporter-associated beta strand protein